MVAGLGRREPLPAQILGGGGGRNPVFIRPIKYLKLRPNKAAVIGISVMSGGDLSVESIWAVG